MTINVDKRYELFGWDYETQCRLTDEEIGWHIMWASRTGGPLLGLACGTARLLCRLALAGFEVVGMDLSQTMLDLARKNVAVLPPRARRRIHLVMGNMSDFDLSRRFRLVFIADNSFREQKTRKDLLSCLRCIRQHLSPEGKLLISERRFDPSIYPNGRRSFGWSQPIQHPGSGEVVSRRGEIRLSKERRRIRGRFFYKILRGDGTEVIEECPWSVPLLHKHEYLDLFRRAGFTTETFVGYRETADDGKNPILCFVCQLLSMAE